MLTRLGAMLPLPVRGMWIGTFHGLCNRFLRAHWKLAGAAAGLPDPRHRRSAVGGQAHRQGDEARRGALRARSRSAWFIAGAKEDGLRPGDVEIRDEQSRTLAAVYQAYQDQCEREGRGRLCRAAAAHLRADARQPGAARALPAPLPAHPGRRVPGHQQAAVRLAEDVRRPGQRRRRRGDGGRRRRPEHLCLPRRAGRQHGVVRARVPRRPGDQARAQLPLVRPHPRQRQCADRAQLAPAGQEPAHRGRAGRAGAHLRVDQRLRRDAVADRGGAASCTATASRGATSRCCTAAMRRAG